MKNVNESFHPAYPISELRLHEKNCNEADLGSIIESIDANGFYGSVVVQKSTNKILAGNHRFMAAQHSGAETIPVVFVDVDDDHALRILLADNRTTRLGVENPNMLAELLQELNATPLGLSGTGYDTDALDALLQELAANPSITQEEPYEPKTDPDDVPEVKPDPITKLGDLWILGRHRVLCGDSTSIDAVERLMEGGKADMVYTDPPYGISVVKGATIGGSKPFGSKRIRGTDGASNIVKANEYAPIIGDETTETAVDAYNLCVGMQIPKLILWGGNYYASALPSSRCWIVWDKENSGDFADAELAWTNMDRSVRLFRHMWNGMIKASEHGAKRVHPTQKPIALAEWCFEEFAEDDRTILDLFLGSGSTLIACEKTDRVCFGMEMSPDYVDVIVNRWQNYSGKDAVLDGDGRTFSELIAARGSDSGYNREQ